MNCHAYSGLIISPIDTRTIVEHIARHFYGLAEKELIPLINRLCEAILFEWKDAADLARKTQIQIKEREEEK